MSVLNLTTTSAIQTVLWKTMYCMPRLTKCPSNNQQSIDAVYRTVYTTIIFNNEISQLRLTVYFIQQLH
jgi:hypothetical protein